MDKLDYNKKLYDILYSTRCPFDSNGYVDLIKLRALLLEVFPGKYHLEFCDTPFEFYDLVDVDKIKIILHTDDEHTEWMLRNS